MHRITLLAALLCLTACEPGPDPAKCSNCGTLAKLRKDHRLLPLDGLVVKREGDKVWYTNAKFDYDRPQDHGFWHKYQLFRGNMLLSEQDEYYSNELVNANEPDDPAGTTRKWIYIRLNVSGDGSFVSVEAAVMPEGRQVPVEEALTEVGRWK